VTTVTTAPHPLYGRPPDHPAPEWPELGIRRKYRRSSRKIIGLVNGISETMKQKSNDVGNEENFSRQDDMFDSLSQWTLK